MASEQNKKIVIVHDWLYGGGAEKVVEQLHKMYPEAPIYTSYCTEEWRDRLDDKVVTGYLNRWPFKYLRKYLPYLRQKWFAGLDLSGFDLVISSTGNGEAKFVTTDKNQTHICYCHTPPHFYWRKYEQYLKNPGFGMFDWLARIGLRLFVKPLRKNDYDAAQKVDHFIANSTHIQQDIQKFYNRKSKVIFPPVKTSFFSEKLNYETNREVTFAYWGRHVPDKHIELAIQACNELEITLTVIGEGVETPRLKAIAGKTIIFPGRVSDEQLKKYALSASAFIFPSEEDFGIAPVEAMAAGKPVIAYKSGGALDYVEEGKTGMFFNEQTVESLIEVLKNFKPSNFSASEISRSAEKFSEEKFKENFSKILNK